MKLTLDVENTTTERNGKLHLDPFEPDNSLTMVGMLTDQGVERIVTFDHSEVDADEYGHVLVQEFLDAATVLIMHNSMVLVSQRNMLVVVRRMSEAVAVDT